jgi:transcriptional regulator with XRE-family HTH domain
MNVARAFGAVLSAIRTDVGMTQDDLAEKAGYSRETISRLENGRKTPTLSTVFDLAQSLGVAPSDLVRRVERRQK